MFRVALKNLIAHKIRLSGLVLTVVLGVSFVVGTYVLTDTITKVFDDIFTEVYVGTDVSVRHTSELGMDAARPPVPESLLDDVLAVEGVRAAEGGVFAIGVDIIDANGDRVGNPQAPSFGTTWGDDDALTPLVVRAGWRPQNSTEVAIDAQSFENGGFTLGDTIRLVTPQGPRDFRLVGVAGFGRASNLAGATLSVFEMETAQALLDREGMFDSISVAAEEGVDPDVLQSRIAAVLGADYEAVTSDQIADENSQAIGDALGFFRTFMLIFAFIALFVGAFIVYNTFAIVIAARTRELALVRAIGASGAAVLGSVLVEALITGLIASGIGLGAGILIAVGLKSLLAAMNFEMPSGDLVLLGRTVWVAMLGGPLVTVTASLVPAIRAARVAPIAAMQEATLGGRRTPVRTVGGAALTVGGVVLVLAGLDQGELAWVGAGAVALFVGLAMIAPVLSRPIVAALGAPIEHTRGAAGLLARQNARRNPRRTATTASALMVGTALMAASYIMSSSITESIDDAVMGTAVAELVVTGENQLGFSASLADDIETLADVRSVARVRAARFKVGEATKQLMALPAASLESESFEFAFDLGLTAGTFADLANQGIAVHDDVADGRGWAIGDTLSVTFPTGEETLTLVATYSRNTLAGDYVIDLNTFKRAYVDSNDALVMIRVDDPAQTKSVQSKVAQLIDDGYPGLKVQDKEQYVADVKAQVGQLTSLITALLVLAVVIAVIGVLITMLLSVAERTREIGLLRAVGMSRAQVRSMVRWEAAIVALFGAILGLGLGCFFGIALVAALRDQGITSTVVPIQPLVILATVIAFLGVIASLYPARRAARMNVMLAVASE